MSSRPPGSPEPKPWPGPPEIPLQACPIATSLGTLGRKWTLTILRDIAFYPETGFNLILRNNPGLVPRTLSKRLKEMAEERLIVKSEPTDGSRRPLYRLSPKGLELWPVLSTLFQYGARNHANVVFADGRPRDLEEVFPDGDRLMLGRFSADGHAFRRSHRTRP